MTQAEVLVGDCIEKMRTLADSSVDSIVTDPPYELGFMGKSWDASGVAFRVDVWREALRVLKPGGHLLAFSGSRTYHRMAVAIEDAGFEIRDQIMWVYGSGFPKSHDVSKAIDAAAGAVRQVVGITIKGAQSVSTGRYGSWGEGITPTAPATPEAERWSGWGTALKPAHEPIVVARKPLVGTVAQNVLAHGTGALNIDGCRVGTEGGTAKAGLPSYVQGISLKGSLDGSLNGGGPVSIDAGRWPANLIHDGSEEVVGLFPGDEGASAARFFYSPKASKADRDEGLRDGGIGALRDGGRPSEARRNIHPTVKPSDLMRYLCRLVTPLGGLVLDPFTGSGSTGKGAVLEGFRFLGIELSPEYAAIARARIRHAVGHVAPEPVTEVQASEAPRGQMRLFA